jgi:hypothetical protein
MQNIKHLVELASPESIDPTTLSTTKRRALALVAFIWTLPLAGLWGIAAGTSPAHLDLWNALEVPMLLFIATIAALPIGLLLFRLSTTATRSTDLVLGHATALFAAALVLSLLAPFVALFQHSSVWAGPYVAFASAVGAAGVGILVFFRVLRKLLPEGSMHRSIVIPIAVLIMLEGAALLQVASITTPIFEERTALGRGIDGLRVGTR